VKTNRAEPGSARQKQSKKEYMATVSSSTSSSLALSGLASGFDWQTVVTQLAQAERAPEIQWQTTQSTINQKNSAFNSIKSYLNNLQADVQALKDSTLYDNHASQSSDSTIASATAASAGVLGSFTFNISQLATSAQLQGSGSISTALSPDGNLSAVTIGTASFATPVTSGTFTINGAQVTIATSDSLQQVFDNIAAATNNAVTASYDTNTDTITLTSANPNQEIVLGSGADTSNFLQVARLYNNGSGSITSNTALGSANITGAMPSAHLNTAITDGGSGQGQFTINGIAISFDASVDNIQNVLDRINNSTAGVSASYDSLNNRFVLSNKTTGDTGISVQDVSGNFLAATGLSGGNLVHGKNLIYTVNGGTQQLVSQSNTITDSSSSITGLSVTALKIGAVTVTVSNDTSKITSTIQKFITDYNNVQSYITTQSATSTDSSGKVTAGLLTGDRDASDIATSLRNLSFSVSSVTGLSSALNQLADLGIQTNGKDNTITLSDPTALANALANNLNSVKALFSHSTNGLAVNLDNYLTNTVGDSGTLTNHQASLTKQSASIDTQIANLEKIIASDSAHWTVEFQAMETAQAQINQQLTYLTQQINNGTL
jgi:flagellar hook-associated protein 2